MIFHSPVLLKEVLQYLNPRANENFVDCTIGSGGHALAILEKNAPNGKLLGIDWDKDAIERTADRLHQFGSRVILVNDNYANIKNVVSEKKFKAIRGIVIDLGFSLDQIQASGRGFTFQRDEPLDMRYSLDNTLTAAKILNSYSETQLIKIFRDYGEERQAKKIAQKIISARAEQPILRTFQLVQLLMEFKNPRKRIHPATQIFQALRIAVNDELHNVITVLSDLIDVLDVGGRLAVISFHSLEDRIVKQFFQREIKDCLCPPEAPVCTCGHLAKIKIITKKPVTPSEREIDENFHSRSAKLRVVEKIL
ncbi:MAG: 16S rRNA (cytosine(1402)-N(4))-methyltransferase RsmH [Candidatus Falkowbacteria bacterium]